MGLDAQVAESTALHDRLMASARYVSQLRRKAWQGSIGTSQPTWLQGGQQKTWVARASGHGAHTM